KKAVTHYATIDAAADRAALVALRPLTGRKHQLRVHLAAAGFPIVGDRKYGGQGATIDGVSPSLHLLCHTMRFPHPKTGRMLSVTAPIVGQFKETIDFFDFDIGALSAVEWPTD
ncbi:MAG: pseudouridine synthase, partial [Pseudomonadota bacterium]